MILELPDFIEYTGVVTSEETQVFDGTHFESESALIMGKRYATEMLRLMEERESFLLKKRK
jgi:hypothetical protein